jgi:CheY-like chemotaxis protein/anti-sigma regulatory factor (Ser/Thr protein kinase)
MSELLLDGGLEDDARGMVQSIRSSGRALLAIINDVLDFSKIEADRMEIERQPFGLRECLEAALDLVRLPAAEKGLDLWLEIASDLADGRVGDRHRLRQVLANLLSNAVKFTDSGAVVVTVEAAEVGEASRLRFAVRDTGVGIPVPRLQDLFQAFTQMDPSSTRRVGGSGLGLTISRRLVQMMGGELVVESEEGRGSTFSFVLPLEPSKVPPAARSRTAHAAFDRDLARDVPLEILVVEDSVLNQQVAVLTLERLGYRPDCASSGKEALARLATRAYDLILMDVEMPGMDGIEVTRRIRESFPEERQPRILAVTASALMEDRDRCLAAGMDGFLSKPIELDRFQAALRSTSLPGAPTSAAESEGPLLDPLRIDELAKLRRSPDGPTMAERLLSLFLEESAGWGGRLGSADGRAMSELLHEIRGSALQIGARRLGELATRWEQEARLDDSDGIQWAKRRLAMELEAARAAVADALDTMRDPR